MNLEDTLRAEEGGESENSPDSLRGRECSTHKVELMNLPLPGARQETCETTCFRHTTIFTALAATPLGIPQKPVAFPVQGVKAWPSSGGSPAWPSSDKRGRSLEATAEGETHPHSKACQSQAQRLGSGAGSDPFLILSRWSERCYWQLWRGRGVSGFWLEGQWETSPPKYKACLGKGQALDNMVSRRSLNIESQRLGEVPAGDADLCSLMLTQPRG